jgi:hypothetical protein
MDVLRHDQAAKSLGKPDHVEHRASHQSADILWPIAFRIAALG